MKANLARPRIAVFGNFGAGNLGNEATLRALIANLRKRLPGAEICCICSGPKDTASEYDIATAPITAGLPMRHWLDRLTEKADPERGQNGNRPGIIESPRWRSGVRGILRATLRPIAYPLLEGYRTFKSFAMLRRCDFLVMPGTGMLADHALQREIFRWVVVAKLCRCRLLFVSVGGGPVRRPLNRWFVRTALALADYRSYRDRATKDSLQEIGSDVSNDAIYPDLAFSLSRPAPPARQNRTASGTVIGIGVMNWYGVKPSTKDETIYRDYLARLSMLIARLLDRGYSIRLLIGDMVYDKGVLQDLRKTLEGRGVTYESGRIVDEPASCLDELLSQLAMVDVVVSSRFHNLLLAIMLGKPVFAISYHEKFRPLMDGVGLGEFCQDIESINVDELMSKLLTLQKDAPDILARTARETERYRTMLDDQYEVVCGLLTPASGRGCRTIRASPHPLLRSSAGTFTPSAPAGQRFEPPVRH